MNGDLLGIQGLDGTTLCGMAPPKQLAASSRCVPVHWDRVVTYASNMEKPVTYSTTIGR